MEKKNNADMYTEIVARIIPKSSKNEIIGGDFIKIRVTSPPVDGKANKAVIDLLAKQLKIPKKDIQIVAGEKSRNKKIRVYGLSETGLSKLTG